MSDGFVSGVIINSLDTLGSVTAEVSCTNKVPGGFISGIVQFFNNGQLQKYKFSSDRPVSIKTTKSTTSSQINASFKNVTLTDIINETTRINCHAVITATNVGPNNWRGKFEVTCPNGPKLTIYGMFEGNFQVNKQVSCLE